MDYQFWATLIAGLAVVLLVGVGCLIRGAGKHTRTSWDAPEAPEPQTGLDIMADVGKVLDEMERKGQIW